MFCSQVKQQMCVSPVYISQFPFFVQYCWLLIKSRYETQQSDSLSYLLHMSSTGPYKYISKTTKCKLISSQQHAFLLGKTSYLICHEYESVI